MTTNGNIVPARPALRSAEHSGAQAERACRSVQFWDELGSHGSSHWRLAVRTVLQVEPSRNRGGRNWTGPAPSWAGQARTFDDIGPPESAEKRIEQDRADERTGRAGERSSARAGQRCDSNNGITVTLEPACTFVTSSSMTTRQFEDAIEAIKCEPAPPTSDTL